MSFQSVSVLYLYQAKGWHSFCLATSSIWIPYRFAAFPLNVLFRWDITHIIWFYSIVIPAVSLRNWISLWILASPLLCFSFICGLSLWLTTCLPDDSATSVNTSLGLDAVISSHVTGEWKRGSTSSEKALSSSPWQPSSSQEVTAVLVTKEKEKEGEEREQPLIDREELEKLKKVCSGAGFCQVRISWNIRHRKSCSPAQP